MGSNYYGAGDNYGLSSNYAYQAGGFFGSIGKALGGVAKAALGVAKFVPGPIGQVATLAGGILKGGPKPGTGISVTGPWGTGVQIGHFPPPSFGPDLPQQPVGTLTPGGLVPGVQLPGCKPNKSSYYRAVPGNPMQGVLIPKGSVCVKTRRINVANPRALRRAVRRAQGFAKMARRVLSFVSAKAPKGRARFRRKR